MSLRRKLLIVLLLTAVLPMLAVRAIQAYSIYRLQASLAQEMRQRLTERAEQEMLQTVKGYAKSLDQQAKLAFALLQLQATEVERRLDGPPPHFAEHVPTVSEFSSLSKEENPRIKVVSSDQHSVINNEGQFEPMLVSYDTQVVLIPSNSEPQGNNVDDIDRLASMTAIYRKIREQASDIVLWQYTSLASGPHFSYPGKSGFPSGFDPKKRGWYRKAIAERRPIASHPFIDSSTRQLVITFAQPIKSQRGPAAGVTAIDLLVSKLLDPGAINSDWAEHAHVTVVAAYPGEEYSEEKERVERQRHDAQRESFEAERQRDPRGFDGPTDGAREDFPFGPPDGQGFPGDDLPPPPLKPLALESSSDTSLPADVYIVADIQQKRVSKRQLDYNQTLPLDDQAQRQKVADDLVAGNQGVQRVVIDGEDRMIAYGPISGEDDRRVFALISAPTLTILAPAEAMVSRVESDLRDSLVNTGGILVILLIGVGVLAYGLSYRLTRPIVELARAARRVASGDLETRVHLSRRDEIGELGKAFNEMVPALHDRMRIRESLAVAMQVQQSLLPDGAPQVKGLDIAGHSEYCDETGGDYYDFIQLDTLGPDTLAVAVGDVTGHGIAAALLMATGRALIRSHANNPGSLGEVFTAVNRQLCDSEFTGRFMTLMYLVVEGERRDGRVPVRFLSAGHDPVIVYRANEDRFIELAGRDIPLGIDAGWSFSEQQSDDLRSGDVLVVGTDGIWECFNPQGEQFGKDRLRETIRQASTGNADSIARAVSMACRAWRGDREQADDITLVVVKLEG